MEYIINVMPGLYLRKKPVGVGVRQVVSPTLSFPLSLPSPFHSPYIFSLPVGGKVSSREGEVPPPLQIPPCVMQAGFGIRDFI